MDADVALLQELVGNVDEFSERHWGQRSLHRSTGRGFTELLTVDEVERLLLTAARRPTFRLVRDGVRIPPERSTMTLRLGGQSLDDVADLGRIAAAVDEGATLVLQGLQRTSLPVARFCRSLEQATSHPVQANAYLTPGGATGLAAHSDEHDVLVLQVTGVKEWKVDDLGAVRTEPGGLLYIPAGVRHAAEAQDGASLHLTVGLLRVTRADAVRRALDGLAGDALDRPLPLGYARPERAAALEEDLQAALSAVVEAAVAAELPAWADSERTRARRRRRPLPTGQLRSVLALDALELTSRVARRSDHAASLAPEPGADGRIVLELLDRRLRLPQAMAPAVRLLLAEPEVAVGDLPGLDDGSKLVLARRLVREALLTVSPPPT
ncbi:MAG: cupin domain-containing protein [Acidimicrobiales bacterium]|nr:cupin domain-containing protein [Acidimicrobiales bacterium]